MRHFPNTILATVALPVSVEVATITIKRPDGMSDEQWEEFARDVEEVFNAKFEEVTTT